jgi:hypothetical protein
MFKHPFTCLVSGPTQSGKTHFVFELIKNIGYMISPVPTKVIWCFGQYQEQFAELPDFVELSDGLGGIENVCEKSLIIIDDLMQEAGNAQDVSNLFTKGSHHRDLSVILIVQNLFHQGKIMRTISLNSHYMVLFKNPRDGGQVRYLGSQLFPGQVKYFVDAYKQATSRPHGYLFLDLTQSRSDRQRVMSDILPDEEGYYYVPK